MSNEMRLIDAYTAAKDIESVGKNIKTVKAMQKAALIMIAGQPTVDAVPVVHGRWELLEKAGNDYWCCSACDRRISEYWAKPKYNYCPNCGAKMDGGNEDA